MYRSSTDTRVLSLADQVSSANRAACPPPGNPSRNHLKVSIQVAANYSPAEMTFGVRVPYSHGHGPQRRIRSPPFGTALALGVTAPSCSLEVALCAPARLLSCRLRLQQ